MPSLDLRFFSGDGNYLFYTARDGGREGSLYKTPIFGGTKQKIMTDVLSDIAISNDGQWIAFIRAEDYAKSMDLVICKTDGSGERVISTKKTPDSFRVWGLSPSWSPDRKRVLTTALTEAAGVGESSKQYLIETDIESGIEKRIKSPEFYRVSQSRFMSDGKSIVTLAKETADSPMQIWQISYPGGKTKRITNDLLNYRRLNISRDGTFILTNERNITSNISLIDSSTGKIIENLTNDTSIMNGSYGLKWTPDGKQIVYSKTVGTIGNIWRYDLQSKQTHQITFDTNKNNLTPSLTPDGKTIVFLSNHSSSLQVWKIDIDGTNLKQLTKGAEVLTTTLSPDGKWLFYDQLEMLWRKPLNGGEPTKVIKRGGTTIISPDSKKAFVYYFDANEKNISPWKWGLMPIDGSTKPETSEISAQGAIAWSKAGTGIYYTKITKNLSNIWIYSLSDKTSRVFTDFDSKKIDYLDVSPDGKKIAIARGRSNSEIIKITGFN